MASYTETLSYIFNLRGGEIDLRLHRVERALSLFGHPERSYPAFHIAGTNGKGSTAAMLHRVLSVEGYRVALYTSPHVVSFTERIVVGEEQISQEEVVELAELLKRRLKSEGVSLTFFEFVTVLAFIYFARRQVEIAVVEVGLGGRLDATNVVRPRVSVITTISKDHEAYLGSDLLSIAREKGGIIKRKVPLVCGALPPEVSKLLKGMAEANGSASYFLGQNFSFVVKDRDLFDYRGLGWHLTDLSLALRGRHQRSNAALALSALEIAAEDFPISEKTVRQGLATVFWPGRFEIISRRPTVILDGAHNGEGVKALVEEIKNFQGSKKVALIFAAMEDKDWAAMLGELAGVASEVVLTRVPMERSADPRKLVKAVPESIPSKIIEQPVDALNQVLRAARTDETVLVTGSLYLLGELRPLLTEKCYREFAEREV
ncbi:MAG TPA: folylpolyglutamate synthase/dihydrofolate synthase family protein [Candidatus Binatia bacterium]|jgi:dihydrofolate synthase/folylpolyglutamate synthase|nr:folylpolyglutamate synthase/dihydrofolate synthase family protein [Candidatus Binatia bacterium]